MTFSLALSIFASAALATAQPGGSPDSVEDIFAPAERNLLVMEIEAALAEAQAAEGVISQEAAREIRRTANLETVPLDAVAEEYDVVRHRMVALLNVWRRSLSEEAAAGLHFGATTVDIYDTVRILQVRETIRLLIDDMLEAEDAMLDLAEEHADTLMIGRTLGQHALPITFGKKVSVWAAANRRNIERLQDVDCRLKTLGVMRGAVGSHLGLGPKGIEIEERTAEILGLGPVDPADWHGMRDVFGEYAAALAIASRTYAKIGDEIFTMQMNDIGELYERRPNRAVSSSTMPHKRNPSRSEALRHAGRVIPAYADILLDDISNTFERDNTSRPNRTIEDISIASAEMIEDLRQLIERLEIDEERMLENLQLTDGMILAQRIVFELQEEIGKEEAERRVAEAARRSKASERGFREELLADAVLGPLLEDNIDALLDPRTYTGLAAEQTRATIRKLRKKQEPVCRADAR